MKTILIIIICVVMTTLTSCKFSNEAVLVDNNGHFYYGTVNYDPEYQTGSITFPHTPYGKISGPFTVILTDNKNPLITLKNIPLEKYSGKAQLGSGQKRCLECDITAEFKSEGMGDMKMIGCGTCYDEQKNTYDISFN
jgi:hypothetical protein